jgi:large subunit ribosomal protein L10
MVKQYKVDEVKDLAEKLQTRGNFILTDYSGVKVNDLAALRRLLAEKNAQYKVVKNNLFKRALEQNGYENIDELLKGPVAVAFAGEEAGDVAKTLKEFALKNDKFSFTGGVIDKVVYNESQIKRIADLPSKEVLLSQTMSLINGPARGIAVGMNQIMASLARGINAVAEANNN